MGRGRPPKPGTAEEKAAARRERVRNNVRALRERRKRDAAFIKSTEGVSPLHVEWAEGKSGNASSDQLHEEEEARNGSISSTAASNNRAGALYLVNRHNGAGMMFPTTVDSKSPYAMALLATVRESFLPDAIHLPPAIHTLKGKPWESEQFLWTPCAFWVTSAFTKASAQETSLLKTSLLSIGMLMKSHEYQDPSLKVASLEMYRRCLQGIRKSLEPLLEGKLERPKDTVALYLSCHAAAMFELVQNSDLSATMHHLRGVSQLICHLGDGRDVDGQSIAWLLLQDYRFAEMGLCLKFRYTSVSSIKRRQFENRSFNELDFAHRERFSHGFQSHNMLVMITDLADDITTVMVQLDALRPQLNRFDALMRLRAMLEKLDSTWHKFQYLYDELVSRYGTGFVYHDPDNETTGPSSYKFKNFDIGAGFCYNLMTQCYCLETSIDALTLSLRIMDEANSSASPGKSPDPFPDDESNIESVDDLITHERLQELRRLHRAVCVQLTQCLQYFLQTDKKITGMSLAIFPLDAAFCMLETELGRLKVDLAEAEQTNNSNEKINTIQKNIASIVGARAFCSKMKDRASSFGLPTFDADGSYGAEDATNFRGANHVSGAAPSE